MTNMLEILSLILLLSIMSFFLSRKKVLMCLLSLEFILLNLFMLLIVTMNMMMPSSYSIFILVLGACEASLGLSILINVTRFKGNDMMTLEALKY